MVLIVIGLVLSIQGCGLADSGKARIEPALDRVARAGGVGSRLELTSVWPSGWDAAYVFGPCEDPDTITRSLGFRWPQARRLESTAYCSDMDKIRYLLVFVAAERVVAWDLINSGDDEVRLGFSSGSQATRIRREKAIFSVEECREAEYCLSLLVL